VEEKVGLPILEFESQNAWESWLAEHHNSSRGVWAKLAKKATGIPSATHPELLDVALCYGWIDGQRTTYDGSFYLQKMTPRTPRSKWSKINRDKVAQLKRQGRMQPAGLAAIERAKRVRTWEQAYDPPSLAEVPGDLRGALDARPEAAAFFDSLNSRNRYAVLYRVHDAKRPETRARRIAQLVEMLSKGEKLY
jgi:uncharacterized protein YdeI (YjbR/CyaY-like superfamily)